jgi:HPt (histidine-containing phosphotransfer) domain-containing protein
MSFPMGHTPNALPASDDTDALPAAADPAFSRSEVLNYQELVERCLGNLGLAERLLAKFQDRFEADLEELEKVVLSGRGSQIAQVAHRMKGAAASMSASRLKELSARIEELGRADHGEDAMACLEHLRREWKRYRESAAVPAW